VGVKAQPDLGFPVDGARPRPPAEVVSHWRNSRAEVVVQTHCGAQNPMVVQQPDSQSSEVVHGAEQLQVSVSPPQPFATVSSPPAEQLGVGVPEQPPSPVQVVPVGQLSSSWPTSAQQTPPSSGVQWAVPQRELPLGQL
jgi:hypothetical protein